MRIASTAALLLAFCTGGALAQSAPALVINDLHHRAGPTSNSPSYGVIRGGITIEAGPCTGGWCATYLNGNPGFVAERYLDFGGPPPRAYYAPPPPPPPAYGPPPVIYAPAPVYPGYPHHRTWHSRRW